MTRSSRLLSTLFRLPLLALWLAALLLTGCGEDGGEEQAPDADLDTADLGDDLPDDDADVEDVPPDLPNDLEHPEEGAIYDFANGCVVAGHSLGESEETRWLQADAAGTGLGFIAESEMAASSFFMKASDLGTYLFYGPDGGYLNSEEGEIGRRTELDSSLTLVDDSYVSGAEWELEFSQRASFRYQLRNRRTGQLLGLEGLVDDPRRAAALELTVVEGCREHPEMALDASGEIAQTTFPDGELYGFVDTHSHILANFGFGGGGLFYGAPFHRLGVEHALGSCEPFHGPDGRADFLGWGSSTGGEGLDTNDLTELLATGLLPEPNHATDGWPTFSYWPNQRSATHQAQYYRWLERAWMSGLRLMVQHAVSNEAICDLMMDTGFQPSRWDCADMVNIDRQFEEIRRMERYIDAQAGGPGEGWFRVVESPAEARQVIAEGKLAIVLGIEVPNLFDCYLTPREGGPECNQAHIEAQLDEYYAKGARVLFPNHKYDNAFTPGDGDKGIFELGNFIQTGHWSNYVEECPDVDTVFDRGEVQFGGFNQPRDMYLSPAPNELIQFTDSPLLDILPYADLVMEPSLPGDWCQKGSLTPAGTTLIEGMMARGMVIELDHLPRRSYLAVFDILRQAGYPAVGTHGNTNDGLLYTELGGMSKTGFGRCDNPNEEGSLAASFRDHRDQRVAAGLHPSTGFGFDLNGLAGVPDPRFGPDSNCGTAQENPVEHPFASHDGGVTFTQPTMGDRVVDFNTEGMIHIGLVPEFIEDARATGVTDEDLEILFRSAEGYIRMWEKAESLATQ